MRGDKQKLIDLLEGKKVAYIATKNSDYIRISQEVSLVRQYANKALIIASDQKKYSRRILEVYKKIFLTDFKEYDIVFIGFMSQMVLPWFKWKFHNAEIIEDFFISIYDTLTDDRKKFPPKSWRGRLVHWIDTVALKSANIIISDTNVHGRYFRDEFGIIGKELLTLYLEADRSIYYPRKAEKPDQWKDKYLVLYFGSILPVQGVNIVLDTIQILSNHPEIHFLIIGPINQKYSKPETGNVTYIDWLSQEKLAEYIAFSDLCLAGHFSKEIGKAQRTIPGKAYIYECLQKPMVLSMTSANLELFTGNGLQVFVEAGNSSDLSKAILVECSKKNEVIV